MFVLFDLEWITEEDGTRRMTQLAAVRTDGSWRPGETFSVLVKPEKWESDWAHVAYSGYSPDEFRNGLSEEDALRQFNHWLKRGDVLCCWHYQNGKTLAELYQRRFCGTLPCRWAAVNQTVYTWFAAKGITDSGGLYECARLRGLKLPIPQHCSANDAALLQSLLKNLRLSNRFLWDLRRRKKEPGSTVMKDRRARNAERIVKSQFHYVYVPSSKVFHRWNCKLVLNAKSITGCIHYKTAAKNRRPCLICKPEPGLLTEQETAHREEIQRRTQQFDAKKQEEAALNEVVNARLLGGHHMELRRRLLVGCCHYYLHPGKLTRQLMEEHDCLGKECRFFEKYEDADYWQERARKAAVKEHLRRQKNLQKEQQQKQEAAALSRKDTFQSYADAAGYAMKIIRVQEEKRVFTVFYVSENPFPDGNRFPKFLDRIWHENPKSRVILRHIQDMDGHFVTTEEYERLRR